MSDDNTFPAMLRRLASRFTPATLIDCGASDGRWSRMAHGVWHDASIIMLEANPCFREALEKTKSDLPCPVGFMNFLVGATEGSECVRFADDNPYQGVYPDEDGVEIPRCTIDMEALAFSMEDERFRPPYLIKLDVHGREHDILAGARKTLKQTGAIIAEVYTWSQGENSMRAVELIPHIEREYGFLPSDLCEPLRRPLDGRVVQVDLLLEPKTSQWMDTARYR